MTKKITKLSDEQWAEILAFRDEALAKALTAGPADIERARPIIDAMCDAVGQKRRPIFHFSSPMIAILAMPFVLAALSNQPAPVPVTDSQLDSQLYSHLDSQLDSQLRSQLGSQLCSQLDSQLYSHLDSQLGSQLCSQLDSQLRSQLCSQLDSQLGSQLCSLGLSRAVGWRRLGHCEMSWWAYYRGGLMAGAKTDPQTEERLGWWLTLAETCGWWWPMESCIIVAGRPETKWDDQRRLHCETGPAIDFKDGCEVYTWHGVQVPKEWIAGKKPTPREALTWENMEQRRAACEILGWASILDQLNGRTVDLNANPEIGELIRVDIPDIGEEQFLRVRCGTGRVFAIPVPPDVKTAAQANAWTYGFDNPEDYQLEVRT